MVGAVKRKADEVADPAFVGRADELDAFRGAFEQMLGGRLQLFTMSGEPGIGKTRCAEAFARLGEDQGALVLWGRCYEEPGAPPYWPWIQILREYIGGSSPDELSQMLGSRGADVAAILPELAGDLEPAALPPIHRGLDASAARFRTFDAVAQCLVRAAKQVPLVLIVDNLHWADAPSLSLLEFLSHELTRSRVLMICTYRDNEVSRKSPLLSTLGGLSRTPGAERVKLGGLPEPAIAELAGRMLGRDLPPNAIQAIDHQTDGNPLFVIELLKVLIEETAAAGGEPIAVRIPDGVREAIGRRLSRLSKRCNELLVVASVLGRHFNSAELAAAAGATLEDVLESLGVARSAGIVESGNDAPGAYRFTHALIRETLYEEIPALDRLRWHGRAGDALAQIHGNALDPVLTRIAHHYYQAAPLGNAEKAADFAIRAASRALRVYAYEEAIAHCRQVVGVFEAGGGVDDERLANAWFLEGYALLCLGDSEKSAEASFKAVTRAHSLGDAGLLMAVLTQLAVITSDTPQRQHAPLFERVLELLPRDDSAARAQALAALAFALRSTDDRPRVASLVDESLAVARRVGDVEAESLCLDLCRLALRGAPETLSRRLHLGEEHVAVASKTGNEELLAKAYCWRMLDLFESGDVDAGEELLARYEPLGVARIGFHEYYVLSHRVQLALLRGEWDGLEEKVERLLEVGASTRPDDAEGVYGAQMFALNRDLGRLADLEAAVRSYAALGGRRAWPPGLLAVCAELSMLDEARPHFERLARDDFGSFAKDDMYVTCLVYCAEACHALDDRLRAETLYARLLPYADQAANHPRAVCFGSAALFLGMLAATLRRCADARRHFDAALAMNRRMGAWPWLARAQFRYGEYLRTLDSAPDRQAGRDLLRDAEQLAGRLGMRALLARIGRVLGGGKDGRAFPDELTAREVEVLGLLALGRSNKDISAVLTISLNTVATHVRNILTKTHCANRTEAAAYAIRNELQPRSRGEDT